MARILLVEDDRDQREIRQLILERSGHSVQPAASLLEALDSLGKLVFDCLLMDLRLPAIQDGLSLIRSARELLPGLPVVVLTGWCEDLRPSKEMASVSALLQKPIRTEHLLRTIDRLVASGTP
jgi:CheY-like chemotaxis protein